MATKNEMIQALNQAFDGNQMRALQAMLSYIEEVVANPVNLPIATESTLGVVSVGAGLDVTAGGELTTEA